MNCAIVVVTAATARREEQASNHSPFGSFPSFCTERFTDYAVAPLLPSLSHCLPLQPRPLQQQHEQELLLLRPQSAQYTGSRIAKLIALLHHSPRHTVALGLQVCIESQWLCHLPALLGGHRPMLTVL